MRRFRWRDWKTTGRLLPSRRAPSDFGGHASRFENPSAMTEKTVFKKIIDRELPADIVYEDDRCLAFRDIHPAAPTHVLVIPKQEIPSVDDLQEEHAALVGHLVLVACRLARELKLEGGYRLVTNCGADAGQSVDHLHFHLLGGRAMSWPPG